MFVLAGQSALIMCMCTFSSLKILTIISFWNSVSRSFQCPTRGAASSDDCVAASSLEEGGGGADGVGSV